jgi:PAS domain S-box-containing protein
VPSPYEHILDLAVAIAHADFATIHTVHDENGASGELHLAGYRGFDAEAVARWRSLAADARTTYAEAARTRQSIVVEDLRRCNFDGEDLERYLASGIWAAQSAPVFSRSGVLLGVISTMWREPHEASPGELRAVDSLAQLAADSIERGRTVELTPLESSLQYKELFEMSPQCIFVLDVTPEGQFRFAGLNPAEERAVGLRSVDVSGKFVDEVFSGDLLKRLLAKYRGVVERGTTFDYDEELDLPAGLRAFHSRLVPLRTTSGRIYRLVGFCNDITDFKHAQREAFARQKLESLGVLAGGIAHDFNNLLACVVVQAELALAEQASGAHPEEELQRIKRVAIQGAEIVRQLMIYAGREGETVEPVNLSQIVREMLDLLRVSVSKRAMLETELVDDLPSIQANAAQLRRVVMNLVTNASEAIGDREGVIRLTTHRVYIDGAAAASNGVPEGSYVQMEVSDTGTGMPTETQARAFDPFFTTKSPGRGLGLAVVQGIVRNLHGSIAVSSQPGKGTAFRILLPDGATAAAAAAAATASLSNGSEPASASREGTVLIVEDEQVLRQGAAKMLRKTGFNVLEAADGFAAIDFLRAKANRIDLILLDLTLPGPSSREIVAEAARSRPETKVILTSAYSREKAASVMTSPQVRAFIRKPYQLQDVVKTFRSILSA